MSKSAKQNKANRRAFKGFLTRGMIWKSITALGVAALVVGLSMWSHYATPSYQVGPTTSQRLDDVTVRVSAVITNVGHSSGSPDCQAEVGVLHGPYDSDNAIGAVPTLAPGQSYKLQTTAVLMKVDAKDDVRITCENHWH